MPYKTAEEFLMNVKSKRANGRRYYTITQVAEGLGLDWNIVVRATKSRDLEKELGFRFIENTFNAGKYFPAEAIPQLYKFRRKVFKDEEDN